RYQAVQEPELGALLPPYFTCSTLQSSPAPSNTRPPSPTAPAHIPPKPRRVSPAHFAFHPQSSTPHTRTLPPPPTIPHSSAASALPPPRSSHAPQNSHNQTPPAAPAVPLCASRYF